MDHCRHPVASACGNRCLYSGRGADRARPRIAPGAGDDARRIAGAAAGPAAQDLPASASPSLDTDVRRQIQDGAGGVLTVLAGLLLFLPGFLTDLVGVAAADRSGAAPATAASGNGCAAASRPIRAPSISSPASGRSCPIASFRTKPSRAAIDCAFLSARNRRVSHTADCTTESSFAGEFIVSSTNGGPAQAPAANPASPPQLMVLAQYIKDLSFENPNAPALAAADRTSRRSTSPSTSPPIR